LLCLIAAVAGFLLARSDERSALGQGNYSPDSDYTLSNPAIDAASDVTIAPFVLPADTLNFGGVILSGPSDAKVACGPGFGGTCPNPPGGIAPILGDVMGTLSSTTTLGISNATCGPSTLSVSFVFLNATVDNSAGNLVYPSTQAQADSAGTLTPLLHDQNTVGPGVGQSQAGAASPANGLPAHVDLYPSYLNVVFDPDTPLGPAGPVQPIARYSGGQIVATTSVILTNQFFGPGALAPFVPPHPYFDASQTALGYTTVSVLQDTTVEAAAGAITDFCTPLTLTAVTFANPRLNPCNGVTTPPCNSDGVINNPAPGAPTTRVRATNPPAAGTYYYGTYQFSQRDSDGDGYENAFDTCPYQTNTDGNPRSDPGPDGDMLDGACDPDNSVSTGNNSNQDSDSNTPGNGNPWLNAGDNCPRNANNSNHEDETAQLETTRRPRGGPATDSLGDACDGAETACADALDNDVSAPPGNPQGPDGLINDGCPTVGSAVAEATCTFSTAVEVDNDLDGYPNDGCAAVGPPEAGADCEDFQQDDDDNGDTVINNSDNLNDGCPAQGGPEFGCLNSADDDNDGTVNDGCPSSSARANGHYHTDWDLRPVCVGGVDADNDGYCNAATTQAGLPADPNDGNASLIPETYSQYRVFPIAGSGSGNNPPSSREPLQVCNDGVDNDGDTFIDDDDDSVFSGTSTTDDCRPPDTVFTAASADSDGDGAKDVIETLIATHSLSRCGRGLDASATVPNRSWPMDMRGETAFSADKVNVQDLGTFTTPVRRLNTAPGQAAYNRRWDLRPGNNSASSWITVADLAVVSTQVPPPMHAIRAFGLFSVCSAHKTLDDGPE
jgi:hypothetical protein